MDLLEKLEQLLKLRAECEKLVGTIEILLQKKNDDIAVPEYNALKELSDERHSFRDMCKSILESVSDNAVLKNLSGGKACVRLFENIVEEDVHD